jgi:poly-gamma-glutamate capsule biosynthesis protein CapA/YwtB (metallophosphatase superfamily)
MRPELLPGLVRARILLVNCANNHSADFHSGGILETIKNLDRYGIKHIGIGANSDEAHAPVVLDINGVRLGFLGYADSRTFIAGRKRPGRTSMSRSRMLEDIRKLKPSVDFVIVNLHWGKELAEEPDSSQILLAHGLIDGGADLIIGHHPHVLQGIEIYGRGFIAYSLGNFVFGGNSRSVNSETAVLKAVFSKKDMKVKPLPVCIRGWKPALADSLSGLRILKKIEARSRMFRDPFSSYN